MQLFFSSAPYGYEYIRTVLGSMSVKGSFLSIQVRICSRIYSSKIFPFVSEGTLLIRELDIRILGCIIRDMEHGERQDNSSCLTFSFKPIILYVRTISS